MRWFLVKQPGSRRKEVSKFNLARDDVPLKPPVSGYLMQLMNLSLKCCVLLLLVVKLGEFYLSRPSQILDCSVHLTCITLSVKEEVKVAQNTKISEPTGAVPSLTTTNIVEGGQQNDTTTTFDDSSNPSTVVTVNKHVSVPIPFQTPINNNVDMSLADFFARPYLLQSGVLSATDTPSTFSGFIMPRDLMAIDLFYSKFKGSMAARFDMEFTLKVNANPFQQGRYMLCWCPIGGTDASASTATDWILAHTFSPFQRTQLLNVQIDLSTETSATLVVPFSSMAPGYPIHNTTSQYQSGQIRLFPYQKLTTGTGSVTAGYSLWVRLLNVRTGVAVVPNSMNPFEEEDSVAVFISTYPVFPTQDENPDNLEEIPPVLSLPPPLVEPESGVTDAEFKSAGVGPVQSASVTTKRLASYLTGVPIIGPYAGMVSWASDIVNNVASVFGWSKVTNGSAATLIQADGQYHFAHYDGVDNSKVLSACQKNSIEVVPGLGGTNLDEMDLNFFLGRPSFFDSFVWTTSTTTGSELFDRSLSPSQFSSLYTDTKGNGVINYTPVGLISTMFNYWRGDFIFTFKFVKTRFHSGRLSICGNYNDFFIGGQTTNLNNTAYINREIVDIREMTEFSITVPYSAMSEYLVCGANGPIRFGNLTVKVLDPLTCPDTVDSSVKVLVEVSCARGFEFAMPVRNNVVPILGTGLSPVLNSGISVGDFESMSKTIGDTTLTGNHLEPSRACIGERITSIRQLIKRPTFFYKKSTYDPTTKQYFNIAPFHSAWAYSVSVGVATLPNYFADQYSVFASIYMYHTGGMRYKITRRFDGANTDVRSYAWIGNTRYGSPNTLLAGMFSDTIGTDGSVITNNQNVAGGALMHVERQIERNGSEYLVPSYNRFHCRNGVETLVSGTSTYSMNTNAPTTTLTIFSIDATDWLCPSRCAADDGSMYGFVSIPPVIAPFS